MLRSALNSTSNTSISHGVETWRLWRCRPDRRWWHLFAFNSAIAASISPDISRTVAEVVRTGDADARALAGAFDVEGGSVVPREA